MNAPRKPTFLSFQPEGIPAEVRRYHAWVGWRFVYRNGNWTKQPMNLLTGALAKTNDPSTWTDFETGISRFRAATYDGIGLCRSEDLVFIDLDGVLDESGHWRTFPWIKPFARLWDRAYFAKSVSGMGVHIICRGVVPKGKRQIQFPAPPEHTGFGIYDANRFLALSGHTLSGGGVCPI